MANTHQVFVQSLRKIISAPMKKRLIIGVFFFVMLVGIFIADDWQQRRYATLKHGYNCMDQCQYEDATLAFEEYLNVNFDIYWYLLEFVNDESCSRKNVEDCLERCMAHQTKTYPPRNLRIHNEYMLISREAYKGDVTNDG